MSIRIGALLAVAVLALPAPCFSQELSRLYVTMKPLEAVGEVDPEFAKILSRNLMQAIERNSDFRIKSAGPTRYYLKGQVSANKERQFVTLQLFETHTNRMLWLQNYADRDIAADLMAEDVIAELSAALAADNWR
jgi:hypothetical protein